jgi:glycosyltransferase involved in cell wall biosynthesis
MKIAVIAPAAIPSVTANSVQVMKVCQALVQNGEEVNLFVPENGNLDWQELKAHYGLTVTFPIQRVRSEKFLKRFDFILNSLRQAKRNKTEAIYTRMIWVAAIAAWLKRPVIFELHDLPAGRLGMSLFKCYLMQNGKKLTAFITDALQRLVEKSANVDLTSEKTIIAPDGVDLERYEHLPNASEARVKLGLKDVSTVGYSGGFYEGRGLGTLLKLAGVNPKIQFLLIGGKPDAVSEWRTHVNKLGLTNVVLTGFVDNQILPLYQAAADILIMPYGKTISGSSGGNIADVCSPMKMFEYMASGRAILTSDIPVLREVLSERTALFYTPEEFDDLCEKLTMLLTDTELKNRLCSKAREEVGSYSWRERMQRILTRFIED